MQPRVVALLKDANGFDVSHHNGDITPQEWQLAGDSGQAFVFIKCAEGLTFIDSRFVANWSNSRCTTTRLSDGTEQPLQRGPYFFFRPDIRQPLKQAEHYWDTFTRLGGADSAQLELAVDVEDPVTNGKLVSRDVYRATIEDDLHAFINRLGVLAGAHRLALYTRKSYADELLPNSQYLSALALWCANYPFTMTPTSIPRVPKIWQRAKYWQYDNGAQRFSTPLPGVGVSDRNKFLG